MRRPSDARSPHGKLLLDSWVGSELEDRDRGCRRRVDDDIVPGKFLGIASVSGAGVNRALEVVVFDESMRGVGEGDYPWDLGSGHSSMTNGTMAASHSTMTNATVGAMSGSGQKTITMNEKGGSRKLVVPVNAPVVRVAPGKPALLVAGASVFVIATTAATAVAAFIVIGIDGVKPPM